MAYVGQGGGSNAPVPYQQGRAGMARGVKPHATPFKQMLLRSLGSQLKIPGQMNNLSSLMHPQQPDISAAIAALMGQVQGQQGQVQEDPSKAMAIQALMAKLQGQGGQGRIQGIQPGGPMQQGALTPEMLGEGHGPPPTYEGGNWQQNAGDVHQPMRPQHMQPPTPKNYLAQLLQQSIHRPDRRAGQHMNVGRPGHWF